MKVFYWPPTRLPWILPYTPRFPRTSIHVNLITQPTPPHDCRTRKVLPQSTIINQRHRQSETLAILSPEESMLQNVQPTPTGKRTRSEIATRQKKKNVFHHHPTHTKGSEAHMSTHNYILTHAYTDHTNQQCHTKAQPPPHEIRVSRKYAGRPKVE